MATKVAGGKRNWPGLYITKDVALVSGGYDLALPLDVDKIITAKIVGESSPLSETALELFEEIHPDWESDALGTPEEYIDLGKMGAKAKSTLAAGSIIKVLSDSASDTTPLNVRIVGTVAGVGSLRREEVVTLTGLTPAYSTILFTEVYSITKSAAFTGVCNVTTDVDGATRLAEIPPNVITPQYLKIRLYPTPDATDTLRCFAKRTIYDMIEDTDIPADLADEEFALMILGIAEQIITKDPSLGNLTVTSLMNKSKRAKTKPGLRYYDTKSYRKNTFHGKTLGG